MTNLSIVFAPQLPLWVIIAFICVGGAFVLWGLIRRVRGSLIRTLAFSLLALALFNPSFSSEDREQIKSVIALVVDRSTSQTFDDRKKQTDAIRAAIAGKIEKIDKFELREVETSDQISSTTDVSTALFKALSNVLQDVPPEQVGGAILITDGQVHDIPKNLKLLGIDAPIHALITGTKTEKDRRVTITNAPKFAVVGETVTLGFRVDQQGISETSATVTILIDGEEYSRERVNIGEDNEFFLDTPHGGKTVIEFHVETVEGEITPINNRAFTSLNGIRENLRVLLVSGEPHAGERTWRNLLKSDPSVDLVHFTILRPPEKQDGTPINELSLIAFPTRELFVEKIDEFDLIIFDRYRRRNVLLSLFFDNIARYVEDGGALLVAAGPEFSDGFSIAQTALQRILPALPDGRISEKPFRPKISDLGQKHPVTRNLDPNPDKPAKWSHWFRSIGAGNVSGTTVMNSANDNPLLVLNRIGEGRVALFLSDHVWLWARGFDGGGPYVQLLRRLGHWLMKEPELSEEALTARVNGNEIIIQRQTLEDETADFELTTPDRKTVILSPEQISPGVFEARLTGANIGLYQAQNGDFRALTHLGPTNPREFSQVVSTKELLTPLLEKSGGAVLRASQNKTPRIIPVRANASLKGNGWIGLKDTQASILRGVNTVPLFNGLIGLAMLLLTFAAMWTREGR